MRTNQTARASLFSETHICGCYFLHSDRRRIYLPQISLKSHSTINAQCFTTKLTQTFYNSNEEQTAKARYAFPLYDGVTVNGYTISYADKVLQGTVKQRDDARTVYQAAVDRGETAGLLESLPAGVFGVSLGNLPPRVNVIVEVTYCGELKHDAGIDGLRYTLPTSIAPRYGTYPGRVLESNAVAHTGISIVVDIDTADAPIRRVQSTSHPIAVSMGELSHAKEGKGSAPYVPSQASATLSLGTTELEGDFVLQMVIERIGDPQAIIESHPTLPCQRAIMATLVPKFALKSSLPEIVFVADQSGSMRGSKNNALKAALRVFLKSLPLGVRFNICAFGSSYRFLWPKSQAYNESNLDTAIAFVETFGANDGGTEILAPITAAFENRLGDLPFEVMLLTDGEIWAEAALFGYINKQIHDEAVDGRVFTLGIGSGVSHTLVEGVARAGNGFAQFVDDLSEGSQSNDDMDRKVIRMLKAALFAHTKDYQLEVHYDDGDTMQDDGEFELVEKVNDCLSLRGVDTIAEASAANTEPERKKPRTFFDPDAELDDPPKSSTASTDRYAHLPKIDTPKILQAPTNISPLFPFNRSTVYLVLGPESPQRSVRSVTLRAISAEGPLELNIPVKSVDNGSTIHQLAARKAIQDLEEGRGWLNLATVGAQEEPAKGKFASRFDELVEREAVRIGEKFQVAGKWTSFVAVEQGPETGQDREGQETLLTAPEPRRQMAATPSVAAAMRFAPSPRVDRRMILGGGPPNGYVQAQQSQQSQHHLSSADAGSAGAFGLATVDQSGGNTGGSLFGSNAGGSISSFGDSSSTSGSIFGSNAGTAQFKTLQSPQQPCRTAVQDDGSNDGAALPQNAVRRSGGRCMIRQKTLHTKSRAAESVHESETESDDSVEKIRQLITLQTFSGAWVWTQQLFKLLGVAETEVDVSRFHGETSVAATVLVVAFLQTQAAERSGVWELVADKAKAWLKNDHRLGEREIEGMITTAKGYY